MLSFSCPKCGGTTKFDETKEVPTYCMFCGAHLPDMTEFVKESLKLGLDRKQLNLDRERHNMNMEEVDQKIRWEKTRRGIPLSQMIAIILAFIVVVFMFILISRIHSNH